LQRQLELAAEKKIPFVIWYLSFVIGWTFDVQRALFKDVNAQMRNGK
jgi:hypothetical protein